MGTRNFCICASLAASLLLAACASSPLDEQRRLEKEQAVDDILSYVPDPLEYGETKRCLSANEANSVRGLDDRHVLVRGSRKRLWVSTLRGRCPGLDDDSALIIEKFGSRQICRLDHFEVLDTMAMGTGRTGVRCVMGDFQPITEEQLEEVEAIIDAP